MRIYKNKREFYKGDDWGICKMQILNARLKNGIVYCEHCGEPIIKSFNPQKNNNAGAMAFHHKIPLTDTNVNDASISINPANIQIVHWQCHNQIHNRFAGAPRRVDQKVYLVIGAPCSGKTTFAKERASEGDIVLDIDDIWQAVTALPRYNKPSSCKPVVFAAHKAIEEQIALRAGSWYQAFILAGNVYTPIDRERYANLIGADEIIVMDTPREVCIERLRAAPNGRNVEEYEGYINTYYRRYLQ